MTDTPRGFTALDKATLIYVVVATAALGLSFLDDDIPGWQWLVVAHVLLVALVFLAPAGRRAGPAGRFLADWYPLLLLAGLYGEIGVLTLDAGFQNDWIIQRLEEWTFGSEVAYRWIREMPSPWLSWTLHSCYIAYYPILYASPFGLWIIGRREESRRTILAVMVTFYLCYLVFLFFPVAGPGTRSTLPTTPPPRWRRPGSPSGCWTTATPGARRSRRRTSRRRSWRRGWRCATGARSDSCSCPSRSAW